MTQDIPKHVHGARQLAEAVGGWPSFHDAEVLELHLVRGGVSKLVIDFSPCVQGDGNFVATFKLHEVDSLDLQEFNRQNVVGRLSVDGEGDGVVLSLAPCYGMNGHIKAARVEVELGNNGS